MNKQKSRGGAPKRFTKWGGGKTITELKRKGNTMAHLKEAVLEEEVGD